MIMQMNTKDKISVVAATTLIVASYGISLYFQWPSALGITVCISAAIVVFLITELYRRQVKMMLMLRAKQAALDTKITFSVQQIQSLIFLNEYFKPQHPFPPVGDWAACSDFLVQLVSILRDRKPETVVDLGSGLTTLIAAYCLEKNGKGTVQSFDHDKNYADKTKKILQIHGLEHRAKVFHAPLVKTKIGDEQYLWYEQSALDPKIAIDVLIVDGPPGSSSDFARYPALPLLYKYMNRSATIMLDDGAREAERIIARRWETEFPDFYSEYISLEKGLHIFQRD